MKKLGIVVPYRNRPNQLSQFKQHLKNFILQPYQLIVVEQTDNKEFNRGKLLNIGFLKAEELGCDYVVFHDVDMLPLSADYSYSDYPVHLISDLELPPDTKRDLFDNYFGGVTLFPANIYRQINGYSNNYFGWGFEDDDVFLRCIENGINIDTKIIPQYTRNTVGLEFNGKDSFVGIKNTLKSTRNFSIYSSFTINKVNSMENEITDNNSIFSIPGFDTTLAINSFFDVYFQFWKKDLSSISLSSKLFAQGHVNALVTINNTTSPLVTLYINGIKVGSNSFDKLSPIQKTSMLYLGVGDPNRKEKNNWFKGIVDRFVIFDTDLNEKDSLHLSSCTDLTLFNKEYSQNIKHYYEMLNVNGNILMDLVGDNDAYIHNCEQKYIPIQKDIKKPIPHRRKGKFKVLPHDENGYKDGYWVNWASRENQLRYLRKYYENRSDYQNDGLSTLKYKVRNSFNNNNYSHLEVKL